MENSLKQFVPSQVCLGCDGCCRFKESDSAWRPKTGIKDKQSLAKLITAGDLDSQGYINTLQKCGQNFCRFLNDTDNTCGIYNQRPFECSLYPFILSQTPRGIKVYVHLSCPFVQDNLSKSDYEQYIAYLKRFFHQPDIRSFLTKNHNMFHDYSAYAPELLHLFDLEDDGARKLLDQKPLMESFLSQGPRPLSGFSFTSLFAWSDFFDYEFKVINGRLCIIAHGATGPFLYLPPLGGNFDDSTLNVILATGIKRVENIPENLLSVFKRGGYNQYTKSPEYIYRREDLIGLHGNAYKSQRHDCNVFRAHQPHALLKPYEDTDFGGCLELYERWAGHRAQTHEDDVYRAMLEENRLVHSRLLRYRKELGLVVRVLKSGDEKIIGYTLGYKLDEETFCIYAEIMDVNVAGAAAFLFRSFCADHALRAFSRINTMDDFGMPGVAKAKQAYHPSELLKSYSVAL